MDPTTTRARILARPGVVAAIPLVALLLTGCAAGSGAASPTATPGGSVSGAIAPGLPTAGLLDVAPGGGTTSASAPDAAVAYPYPAFGGSAGLAPDHELVVSGTGTAAMKADASDRATAQRTALAAAVDDARSQAEAAARDAGVTLGGVVSMSVSVGGTYMGLVPMDASGAPDTAPSSSGTVVPPAAAGSAPGAPSVPTTEQLEVTVTVAYSIS